MLNKPPRTRQEVTSIRMEKEILSRADLVIIFQHHSQKFRTNFYKLIQFYFVIFAPAAYKLFNQATPKEKLLSVDTIELFFYLLYSYHLGYYPGPAPPFEILQHRQTEFNLNAQFAKRMLGRQKGSRKDKTKFDNHRDQFEAKRAVCENPLEWGKHTPAKPSPLLSGSNDGTSNEPNLEPQLSTGSTAADCDSSDWETDSDNGNSSDRSSESGSRSGQQASENSIDLQEVSSSQEFIDQNMSLSLSDNETNASSSEEFSSTDSLSEESRDHRSTGSPKVCWKQNVKSPTNRKAPRRVWNVPKGPVYYTRNAIQDQSGNNIAGTMRPSKDDFDPRREIRSREQDAQELDPDYWDHRVWELTGQVPGQSWSSKVATRKPDIAPKTGSKSTTLKDEQTETSSDQESRASRSSSRSTVSESSRGRRQDKSRKPQTSRKR